MARTRKNTEEPTVADTQTPESAETVEVAEGAEQAAPRAYVRKSPAERAFNTVQREQAKLDKLVAVKNAASTIDEQIAHQTRVLDYAKANPEYDPNFGQSADEGSSES